MRVLVGEPGALAADLIKMPLFKTLALHRV
jgi:hypothetical protein